MIQNSDEQIKSPNFSKPNGGKCVRNSRFFQDNVVNSSNMIQDSKKDLKAALQTIKLKQKLGNVVDKTAARRLQKLQKENYRMLNDLSIVMPEQVGQKSQSAGDDSGEKKGSNILERLNKLFPPFNPASRIKLLWDVLQLILTICILFVVPIHLIFQIDLMQLIPSVIVYTIIPGSLMIDIMVNLNTACFLKGVLTTNRGIIFRTYLSSDFKYDLIANTPLLVYCLAYVKIDPSQPYQIYRFIILSVFYKVPQFNKVFKRVEDEFPLSTYTSNVISLVKLLFSIVLNLHISALAWLIIGFVQRKEGNDGTWMDAAGISDSNWYTQYIYSYYFSTVTMITVGYGDISPRTLAEKLLSIINMMIACGQFAYSVNSIGNIFESFFKLGNEIKANMYVINNYMTSRNISKDLQYQVREYLEYYWKEEKSNNTELEAKILDQLSHKLKDTLLMEANKIALRESPIFSTNFSEIVVQKVLPLIKEIRCTPEEIIYLKGDQDDMSIFFIEKGQIEAFTYQKTPFNKKMKTINSLYTLNSGKFFGAYTFFTGQSRDINIRSLEFTTLLKIKRSDFISLLKDYPDDYEIYCMLRDSATYCGEKNSIMSKCQCCNESDHALSICPLIHFVPSKFNVIRQHSTGRDHTRQKYKRKRHKKTENTYFHNYDYQVRMEDYVNDNMEEIRAYFRKYFIEMGRSGSVDSVLSSDIGFDDYDDEDEEEDQNDEDSVNSSTLMRNGNESSSSKVSLLVNNNHPVPHKLSISNQLIPSVQKLQMNIEKEKDKSNNLISFPGSSTKIQLNGEVNRIDKSEENVALSQININSDKINQLEVVINKPKCSLTLDATEVQQKDSTSNLQILPLQLSDEQKISIDLMNDSSNNNNNNNNSNLNINQRKQSNRKQSQKKKSSQLPAKLSKMQQKSKDEGMMSFCRKIKGLQTQQGVAQTLFDTVKESNMDIMNIITEMLKLNSAHQISVATTRKQAIANGNNNITIPINYTSTGNSLVQNQQTILQPKQLSIGKQNSLVRQKTDLEKKNELLHSSQYLSQMLAQQQFQGQETIDDTMRNYKFFYPQHNITNIIENVIEKKRQKREEDKRKMEEQFQQQLNQNVMIQKRVRPQTKQVQIANRQKHGGNRISKDIHNFNNLSSFNRQSIIGQTKDEPVSSSSCSDDQSQIDSSNQVANSKTPGRKSKKFFEQPEIIDNEKRNSVEDKNNQKRLSQHNENNDPHNQTNNISDIAINNIDKEDQTNNQNDINYFNINQQLGQIKSNDNLRKQNLQLENTQDEDIEVEDPIQGIQQQCDQQISDMTSLFRALRNRKYIDEFDLENEKQNDTCNSQNPINFGADSNQTTPNSSVCRFNNQL